MDDKYGLKVGSEVTKTEVLSVKATHGGYMTLITLTDADVMRMHGDRLEEFFSGLEAIGNAIGFLDTPTFQGEARREFMRQLMKRQKET